MEHYARRNLTLADAYMAALPPGPAHAFCRIPLALAYATLDALNHGDAKLSRRAVIRVIETVSKAD